MNNSTSVLSKLKRKYTYQAWTITRTRTKVKLKTRKHTAILAIVKSLKTRRSPSRCNITIMFLFVCFIAESKVTHVILELVYERTQVVTLSVISYCTFFLLFNNPVTLVVHLKYGRAVGLYFVLFYTLSRFPVYRNRNIVWLMFFVPSVINKSDADAKITDNCHNQYLSAITSQVLLLELNNAMFLLFRTELG